MISDFKIFPNNAFDMAENWYNVGLTVILHISQLKYSQQFAFGGLVAYKPVAYKINKCNA